MSSKPAAVTALQVLHNVQPLSPSSGVLLKALRVDELAERNAADEDKDEDVDKVEAIALRELEAEGKSWT
jgi:adenylate kinase